MTTIKKVKPDKNDEKTGVNFGVTSEGHLHILLENGEKHLEVRNEQVFGLIEFLLKMYPDFLKQDCPEQIGFAVVGEERNLHILFEARGLQGIVPKDDVAGLIEYLHTAFPEYTTPKVLIPEQGGLSHDS